MISCLFHADSERPIYNTFALRAPCGYLVQTVSRYADSLHLHVTVFFLIYFLLGCLVIKAYTTSLSGLDITVLCEAIEETE